VGYVSLLGTIRNFDSNIEAFKELLPSFKKLYCIKRFSNNRYLASDIDGFQNTQRIYKKHNINDLVA